MADEGKGGKGHPIKGRNRAKQLRALFAKGYLSGKGKGKTRKVTYNRDVVIGAKAAHLRKAGGGKPALHPRAAAYLERRKTLSPEQARAERLDRTFKGLKQARNFSYSRNGEFGRGIEGAWNRKHKMYSRRQVDAEADRIKKLMRDKERQWESRSGTWMSKYRPR